MSVWDAIDFGPNAVNETKCLVIQVPPNIYPLPSAKHKDLRTTPSTDQRFAWFAGFKSVVSNGVRGSGRRPDQYPRRSNEIAISQERGIHNPNPRKFLTLLTKTSCSHGGFSGVFDDSICGYIACACLYLNSRHNSVTKWPD
jgi:hypothetical protein